MSDDVWTWTNILIFAVFAAAALLVLLILWRARHRQRALRHKLADQRAPAQRLPVTRAVPADTEAVRQFVAYLDESRERDR